MLIFQVHKFGSRKTPTKAEGPDYRVVLASEAYTKNTPSDSGKVQVSALDGKHPYLFELCNKTQNNHFQNPVKLIDVYGNTFLDYETIQRQPNYSQALQALGITEDAGFGAVRFIAGGKDISPIEAYSLAQNYIFLSAHCTSSSPAEVCDAAKALSGMGIVITGWPEAIGSSGTGITSVQVLDLNETGPMALDTMVIYGFSPSDKNSLVCGVNKSYDNVASNYIQSANLRVNVNEYSWSNLSGSGTGYQLSSLGIILPLDEFARRRADGLQRLRNGSKYTLMAAGDKKATLEQLSYGQYSKTTAMAEKLSLSISPYPRDDERTRQALLEEARGTFPEYLMAKHGDEWLKQYQTGRRP